MSEWKYEGNEHANHCFVLFFFFFFNSQFPCNSHHKVKQIYATEYVVAVMAESMIWTVYVVLIPDLEVLFKSSKLHVSNC